MANELTLKDKALVVIEHIAVNGDEEDKEMSNVYMAAHVANGECRANHGDWIAFVERTYDELVEAGEHKPNQKIDPNLIESIVGRIRNES